MLWNKALIFAVSMCYWSIALATQAQMLKSIQDTFKQNVGSVSVGLAYRDKLIRKTENILLKSQKFNTSQFFFLVDRNPKVQKAFVAFYNIKSSKVTLIGGSKVSTGNPMRYGHFETPLGIFENKPANMSWRALGTKNKNGWMGLGTKGSRVWDLGWQRTVRRNGKPQTIRMLVHSTDPTYGQPRLGTVQSEGCIRISEKLNRFMDYHAILDSEFKGNRRAKKFLLAKRKPFPFSGKFVVIVSSD